jgi:hypothetical protein
MAGNKDAQRMIAECRGFVTAMATAFVTRDQGALLYLSGQTAAGPTMPASQCMLSAAYLVYDVIRTGLDASLGRVPTQAEVMDAWRTFEEDNPERQLRSALDALAEAQIRAGMPEDEARAVIANSASLARAGLVTAIPLLRAFMADDEPGFRRQLAAAAKERRVSRAVLATQIIIRDLFEIAVATAYEGVLTDQAVSTEWQQFMLQRETEPGP